MSDIVKENLPYPIVHYPNHYGTFFAFSKTFNDKPVMCKCAMPMIQNYIDLKILANKDETIKMVFDSGYFPKSISELFYKYGTDVLEKIDFEENICHRCNLITPTLHYCHPMYGGEFMQNYGWFCNQTFLKFGIFPRDFSFLKNICIQEYINDIEVFNKLDKAYLNEHKRLVELTQMPDRKDIGINDTTYWHNVKIEESSEYIRFRTERNKAKRTITKKIENIVRTEFGFKKVGECWVSEMLLYHLVCELMPNIEILMHYRPEWLEGLELDIFIPKYRIGIEYQGQQHFHPIKVWGGEDALKKVKSRDKKKVKLCKNNDVDLIKVNYFDSLTKEFIKDILYSYLPK